MFFIMGISDGRKELDFSQMMICNLCGKYGRYQVFMTYTVLSLFFIPCCKWNKHYYVRTSCCNAVYELDPELGKRIAHGESVELLPEHLTRVGKDGFSHSFKRCNHCGYETSEDFEFCPKCGNQLSNR